MGDVLTFTPRPKRTAPEALPMLAGADLRASLEEAAQTALDAADRIIAVLDRLDGDADHEDGADAEPSLAAPENRVLPEVPAEPAVKGQIPPWRGRGNIVAAVGVALLDLAKVR